MYVSFHLYAIFCWVANRCLMCVPLCNPNNNSYTITHSYNVYIYIYIYYIYCTHVWLCNCCCLGGVKELKWNICWPLNEISHTSEKKRRLYVFGGDLGPRVDSKTCKTNKRKTRGTVVPLDSNLIHSFWLFELGSNFYHWN